MSLYLSDVEFVALRAYLKCEFIGELGGCYDTF